MLLFHAQTEWWRICFGVGSRTHLCSPQKSGRVAFLAAKIGTRIQPSTNCRQATAQARAARHSQLLRGCDRLAHISHSPHQVDHLHILVSRLLLRVSTARVTDPAYWSSQVMSPDQLQPLGPATLHAPRRRPGHAARGPEIGSVQERRVRLVRGEGRDVSGWYGGGTRRVRFVRGGEWGVIRIGSVQGGATARASEQRAYSRASGRGKGRGGGGRASQCTVAQSGEGARAPWERGGAALSVSERLA